MGKSTSANWLPLIDYSNKYKVSISTLRRRIRGNSIQFRLDGGKYFIMDEPLSMNSRGRRTIEASMPDFIEEEAAAPVKRVSQPPVQASGSQDTVFSAANNLLEELKKAYSQILTEKEEMICTLREELVDLKTLVKVLEKENDRLSGRDI